MAVDNTRSGRKQRGFSPKGRFAPAYICKIKPLQTSRTAGLRVFGNGLEAWYFMRGTGDNQFSDLPMWNGIRLAIGIKRFAPFDAEPCLKAVRRIIQPGMYDFAIA